MNESYMNKSLTIITVKYDKYFKHFAIYKNIIGCFREFLFHIKQYSI